MHDVGYAEGLVDTGMHAIDGARALQRFGAPDEVVALVAHHSRAVHEAAERGLSDTLAASPVPDPADLDPLTLMDLVVAPTGAMTIPEDRVAEILSRYGPEDPVRRAVTRSGPGLLTSAARARGRPGLPDEWPFATAHGRAVRDWRCGAMRRAMRSDAQSVAEHTSTRATVTHLVTQ
ncbi:hypothetical protein GCM10027053_18680 [Intrasporangium mesophilum]